MERENIKNMENINKIVLEKEFEIEDIWCSGCALNTTGYEVD